MQAFYCDLREAVPDSEAWTRSPVARELALFH